MPTNKSAREVILEAGERRFVLYGLQSEELVIEAQSPTRRTVGSSTIIQQRAAGPRVFTLTFALFEGSSKRPHSSSIYEGGSGTNAPTTKEQLELIESLVRLQDHGTTFRYHGIAIDSPRCAIKRFDAKVVYATGQGTITFEERRPQPSTWGPWG